MSVAVEIKNFNKNLLTQYSVDELKSFYDQHPELIQNELDYRSFKNQLLGNGLDLDLKKQVQLRMQQTADNIKNIMSAVEVKIKNKDSSIDPIIFYPGYGICQYLESDKKYHYFKALSLQIKVSIPIVNSQHRKLISKDQALVIQSQLDNLKECNYTEVWNRRKNSYNKRIFTGDSLKILEVVQELNYVSTKKPLSYSEKEIYKLSKNLLLDEISLVIN